MWIISHIYVVLSTVKTTKAKKARRLNLGNALRARREALGYSQEALAERIDCHRNYVGLVERGEHNVTVEMVVRFAEALGCRASDVIREAGF